MAPALTPLHATVEPGFVDYNGHMRDGYYTLIFSSGLDRLMDEVGVHAAYRQATGASIYTLELHVWYLQEVHEGAPLVVENRVLDADHKRFVAYQVMTHGETGARLAVMESMQMHVAGVGGDVKSAPFPEAVAAELRALAAVEAEREPPEPRAGAVAIRRKGA